MPVLATMGLKKIYVHEYTTQAPPTYGTMPAKGDTWLDLGDVYQETCTLKDSDPEQTEHKSETSSKKIVLVDETVTTVELSLMDPDLELLARYFGGTISGSAGSKKWSRPRKLPYKEFAVWQIPQEGLGIGCAVTRIIPKFEITYNSKGICLVPMKIVYQDDLQADQAMTDPTQTGS